MSRFAAFSRFFSQFVKIGEFRVKILIFGLEHPQFPQKMVFFKNVQKKFKKLLTGGAKFAKVSAHTVTQTTNMRTKTLLCMAALAAGVATSMAQNVYSLNIVGYANVPNPVGYTFKTAPFQVTTAVTNGANEILPANTGQY